MAYIKLYRERLKHNYNFLNNLFKERGIEWAVVSKMLCGHELFLKELLDTGVNEICDSRLSNLVRIKKMKPEIQTVYIKPPAEKNIKKVVKYADCSFNSESRTIELLSQEAVRQGKIHKVTIMIELGDLREGIMGETLMAFYEKVFELPNIEITSIGTNLNCLHGVMPSTDKLIQLGLYKQLIELKFNKSIPWVTGGTSVVLPLLFKKQVPKSINHFRIGETLFFGNNLFSGKRIKGMKDKVFRLYSQIIEITEKPMVPTGELAENPSGETFDIDPSRYGKSSYRAILDIGLLDISPDFIIPDDPALKIINASSDMLIIDLGQTKRSYMVGKFVSFKLKYMGALRLMNSRYIEKVVE